MHKVPHVPMYQINVPNQMTNVMIQMEDLFVNANMDTSEKMVIVLVSKSELHISIYQNPITPRPELDYNSNVSGDRP
jgi:hypothetical protein